MKNTFGFGVAWVIKPLELAICRIARLRNSQLGKLPKNTLPKIFPALDLGVISPYPTVLIVTTAHQQPIIIESKSL